MKRKKLVTLLGSICLLLMFAALPFMAACAAPAPAPAPTPAPKPTPAPVPAPAPAPAAGVIELKYADQDPATSWANQHTVDPWLNDLEKASKGRVKIARYHGQTLVKGLDLWDAAKYGLADICWAFHGYYPGMTPLADVVTVPFPAAKNGQQNATALWQLFEKFPEMKQSFEKDNKILTFFSNLYDSLATTKKQVKTMADLKGLKIRCPGKLPADAITKLGGVSLILPAPDLYLSLQKGTIDGLVNSPGFLGNFRIDDVLVYYTLFPVVGNYFSMAMNWDTWNKKLPADIKAAWDKEGLIHLGGTYKMGGWVDGQTNELVWKEHGITKYVTYTLPPEELAKWSAIGGKPIWDSWVKEMEGKGLPGQKVLDEYLRLLAEFKPRPSPYYEVK